MLASPNRTFVMVIGVPIRHMTRVVTKTVKKDKRHVILLERDYREAKDKIGITRRVMMQLLGSNQNMHINSTMTCSK